jgi:hypothetical protein
VGDPLAVQLPDAFAAVVLSSVEVERQGRRQGDGVEPFFPDAFRTQTSQETGGEEVGQAAVGETQGPVVLADRQEPLRQLDDDVLVPGAVGRRVLRQGARRCL